MNKTFILALGTVIIISGAAVAFSRAPQKATPETQAAKPDLAVTQVITTPTKKGVLVKYTVKNIGKAPSKATKTRVQVMTKNLTVSHPTPALMPGDSYSTNWEYVVTEGKKMQIKVSADYPNNNNEPNERNNENTISFSIGRKL